MMLVLPDTIRLVDIPLSAFTKSLCAVGALCNWLLLTRRSTVCPAQTLLTLRRHSHRIVMACWHVGTAGEQ